MTGALLNRLQQNPLAAALEDLYNMTSSFFTSVFNLVISLLSSGSALVVSLIFCHCNIVSCNSFDRKELDCLSLKKTSFALSSVQSKLFERQKWIRNGFVIDSLIEWAMKRTIQHFWDLYTELYLYSFISHWSCKHKQTWQTVFSIKNVIKFLGIKGNNFTLFKLIISGTC